MPIAVPVPISPGPAVPSSAVDQPTFDAQTTASLAWQKDELQPKANAIADACYQNALIAADAAQIAESAMAKTDYMGVWADLTGPVNVPASVSHEGSMWALTVDTPDVTSIVPGVSDQWICLNSDNSFFWATIWSI